MTTQDTTLATAPQQAQQTAMTRVRNYIMSPEVKERFAEMMGRDGLFYLNQVLTLVVYSEDLQRCEPKSILVAAMRAASLKLSLDPGQGQAWIIPYRVKGVMTANYQTGYKGIYELAMRTNLYECINTPAIFEGQTVEEDQMTGMHTIIGKKTSDKVIGWMLYFKLNSGFKKTFYMSIEEIAAHAAKYSQSYTYKNSKWNDPDERWKMERKTVLSNGLRMWGRFNPDDKDRLDAIEAEKEWTDLDALPDPDHVTAQPIQTPAQIISDLGFPDTAPATLEPATQAQSATATPAPEAPAPTGSLEPWQMSSDKVPYDTMPTPELKGHESNIAKRHDPADKERLIWIAKVLASRK